MNAQRWQTIEELFHSALEVAPGERTAFLDEAVAGDAELRREVDALLHSFEECEKQALAETAPASGGRPTSPGLLQGLRLGAYQIEREISHGGMGAVYLAFRADQEYQKRVAIKVIRGGIEGAELDRRFKVERQILAGLEHPNIARLLDGGSTEDGHPYLVIEYVEGVNVLEYCRLRNLSGEDRLRLFLRICSAVYYAHQNLIIHRDLKPGNILVNTEGDPKLLDFGIAKLMDRDPELTSTQMALFSPLYASPEQVQGGRVTTATDVYSLGVLLFEMLTGQRPYLLETESAGEAMAAVILQEPRRPSTQGPVSPDFDAIILKALRKEPAERYASVEQLAADIERALDGRPVLAHQGSFRYYASKFIRRNRLAVIAAMLLLVAIVAGLVGIMWQARRAREAQARAERRFQEVRQLANYLVFDFTSALKLVSGTTALQKDVVTRSLQYLDNLGREASGDRTLQLELAAAYQRLAAVLGDPFAPNLGETKRALEAYQKALAAVEAVLAADPGNTKAAELAEDIRMELGGVLVFSGKRADGTALVRRVVEERDKQVAQNAGGAAARIRLTKAHLFLAAQLSQGGGMIEWSAAANGEFDKALALIEETRKLFPQDPKVTLQAAEVHYGILLNTSTSEPAKSAEHFRQAVQLLDSLPPAEREPAQVRRLRASIFMNYGWALGQSQRYSAALAALADAEKTLEELAASDPNNMAARYHLTSVHRSTGIVCGYANNSSCAIAHFDRAVALHEQLIAKDPANQQYRYLRGELLSRTAGLLYQNGQRELALRKGAGGLAALAELASSPNASISQLSDACRWHSMIDVPELRNPQKALPFCERSAEGNGRKDPDVLERLANAQWAAGRHQEAIRTIEAAIALLPPPAPGEPLSRQRLAKQQNLATWRTQVAAGASARSR